MNVTGRIRVASTTARVPHSNGVAGRLWKNGRRLRITSTISEADITDSTNQAVRKMSESSRPQIQINRPKVR